jgi:hypothetical protein
MFPILMLHLYDSIIEIYSILANKPFKYRFFRTESEVRKWGLEIIEKRETKRTNKNVKKIEDKFTTIKYDMMKPNINTAHWKR